jgi:chitinase
MKGVLVIAALFPSLLLLAQPDTSSHPDLKNNAIYLTGDITSALVSSAINYERNILSTDVKFIRYIHARIAYGRWFAISAGGPEYTFTVHALTGANRHHIEGVLGINVLFDKIDYEYELAHNKDATKKAYITYLPQINAGYRYQKPGGNLFFRVCIGIPYLQCSLGFAF